MEKVVAGQQQEQEQEEEQEQEGWLPVAKASSDDNTWRRERDDDWHDSIEILPWPKEAPWKVCNKGAPIVGNYN